MKAALSMVALVLLIASGCTSPSAAEDERVQTSRTPTTRLYVRTVPPGAKIHLSDGRKGTSPQLFDVQPGVSRMTVEMELDGRKGERRIVQIEGGRIIRVEFDFAEGPQPQKRRFVCLVVGKDKITFEGKETTWKELPKLLEKVPDRKHTVLQIARASEDMTAERWDQAQGQALRLVRRFGFEYLSDIGEHPLGSKWEETRTLPEATGQAPGQPSTMVPAESIWDQVRKPPTGWKVEQWFVVPPDKTAAVEKKLGGRIKRLENMIFSAHGQKVQLNLIEGRTSADAEKIHKAVLAMKGDPAYALRFDNTIVEFVGTFDVAFAKRAARELGLQPKPEPSTGIPARSIWERVMNPPEGWTIRGWLIVPPDQTAAIEKKLGGPVKRLSNVIYSAHGQRVQVNVIEGRTSADAEKIHKAVLAMKGDPAYALRFDNTIVEFVGTFDAAFARRLARELRLPPECGGPSIWDRLMDRPEGWRIEQWNVKSLGRRIKKLSNAVCTAHGQRVQVNVYECATGADAEKIHRDVLATKADPAYALRFDKTVVEFRGTFDVAFAKRLARDLGLQPEPGGPKPVSFGPVVEHVLKNPQKGRAELLDLDTGRRATKEGFRENDRLTHAWIRQQQVDVMGGAIGRGLPGVLLFDCAVYQNPDISWEKTTAGEIVDHPQLHQTEPNPINPLATQDPANLPLTCLFETREGTKGVLQLVGLSDDKQGVKIRYRLVRLPDEQAVREVISRFVKAAAEGDKGTVANLIHEKSRHLLEQIDDMKEIISAGMEPAEIDQVIVRGGRALAATKLTQLDHRQYPRPVCMVYILEKQGGSWVIRDVDVEDRQGLAEELRRLQADAPRDESREKTAASPAQVQQVKAQIESLSAALRLYRLDVGSYPTTGQNLKALLQKPVDLPEAAKWQGPYLKGPVPSDPWGRPYRYQSPGLGGRGEFSVWSAGPDGVDATDDDIGNWEPGPRPEQRATAAADRAKRLKANIDSFMLTLAWYSGEQPTGPPSQSLVLHVPTNGFKHARAVQIDKRQAEQIIDHLAAGGFLNSFHDMQDWKFIETPRGPHYTLSVQAGDAHFAQHYSWNRSTLNRLQALRKVLHGDAAEAMGQLLAPPAPAEKGSPE